MAENLSVQSTQEAVHGTRTLRDGTPSNKELEELGNKVVEWRSLGRRLEHDDPQLEEINQAYNQLAERAYQVLLRWKQGKGSSATYKVLCDALEHVQRKDLAEQFCYINEPDVIQQPSGVTASTHASGDSTGERSGSKRKLPDPDPNRSVRAKVDVEAMKRAEHSTQVRTPVSTTESRSGGSRNVGQHGASELPVNAGAPQESTHYPTKEQVLCSIADHLMRNIPPMSWNEYEQFLTYLERTGAILTGVSTGSLLITVKCDSLQTLERLWRDYLSGHLGEVIQRSFVTEEILTEFSLAELKLKTTISEGEYKACKAYLEKQLSEENARAQLTIKSRAPKKREKARALQTTESRAVQKHGKRLEDIDDPPEHTIVVPTMGDLPRAEMFLKRESPIDILLVTVKDCEFLSCYAHLKEPLEKYYVADVGNYVYLGQYAKKKIGLMGSPDSPNGSDNYLSIVKNAFTVLRPRGVIFVGYCIGLNTMKAKLGDVVIPVQLTTYANEMVYGEDQFTGTTRLVSRHFLQLINQVAEGWKAPVKDPKVRKVKVHSNGEILSGPKKIIADGRVGELKQLYPEAVAVEMESVGFCTAASDAGIEWLIVRGIADFAGGIKSQTVLAWYRFASVMAASVVFQFLSRAKVKVFSGWPHYEESMKYRRDDDETSAPVEYCTSITQASLTDEIRQLYTTVTTHKGYVTPFPWHEEFRFHLDSISTTLQVVSGAKKTGTMTADFVNMAGIFKPHGGGRQPRFVLIEGEPGAGKTTCCRRLAYDWATMEPWTTGKQKERFQTVLSLNCYDMKSDLWKTIDYQLLPEDVTEDKRKRFYNSIIQNETKVLLVLDGLDEVAESKLPMISEIIEGKNLPKCRLIATARHEVATRYRKHCDTLLKIKECTKEDAKKFIFNYFQKSKDKAQKLWSELTGDENLKDMVATPLNIALLCQVFEEHYGSFPESRSQLYLDMTGRVLKRYNNKEKLPETNDVINIYGTQLKHLGDIALKGLREEKYDFEESELKSNSEKSPEFEFLLARKGRSKKTPSLRYGFPHRSFQEWFSGFFLYCQLIEKKISPESLVDDKRYAHDLKEVLPYTCGLLAAQCKEDAVPQAVTLTKCMMKEVNQGDRNGWLTAALECTRECKQKHGSFQATMARELGSLLELQTLDPHVGKRGAANVFVLADVLKFNTTVIKLNLRDNDIDDAGAGGLADVLKSSTTLAVVDLSDNSIGDKGAANLAVALEYNKTLTALYLRNNDIHDAGAKGLADALKSNKTLTELNLSNNDISVTGAANLADALKCNETLTELDLSFSHIGDKGVASLADALKSNKALTKLNLSVSRIADHGTKSLADALESNETLTELNLSNKDISATGAANLAHALKSNKALTELNLSFSLIGDEGVASLADALKSNKTLTKLNLSVTRIADHGTKSLADALESNETLMELNLNLSCIGYDGAVNLANALESNKTLTALHLSNNDIGDNGAASLANTLKSNKTLTKINLSSNGISDNGAAGLADALKSNKTLTKLNLSSNDIGENGAKRLADALKSNKTLMELNLSSNGIGDNGAASLADALKSNKTLTELNLSSNGIGDNGAASLANDLKFNKALTKLCLSGNGIRDDGLAGLKRTLESNKKLTLIIF